MTKLELLGCIDYCLKNECALVLNAGDYFTDYLKIVSSHTMKNFQTEVKKYGTHDEEFNRVVIHSVDKEPFGALTYEENDYMVYAAHPIANDEIECIADLVKVDW